VEVSAEILKVLRDRALATLDIDEDALAGAGLPAPTGARQMAALVSVSPPRAMVATRASAKSGAVASW